MAQLRAEYIVYVVICRSLTPASGSGAENGAVSRLGGFGDISLRPLRARPRVFGGRWGALRALHTFQSPVFVSQSQRPSANERFVGLISMKPRRTNFAQRERIYLLRRLPCPRIRGVVGGVSRWLQEARPRQLASPGIGTTRKIRSNPKRTRRMTTTSRRTDSIGTARDRRTT